MTKSLRRDREFIEFYKEDSEIYFRLLKKRTPNSFKISGQHVTCPEVAKLLGRGKFSLSYIPEKNLWKVIK